MVGSVFRFSPCCGREKWNLESRGRHGNSEGMACVALRLDRNKSSFEALPSGSRRRVHREKNHCQACDSGRRATVPSIPTTWFRLGCAKTAGVRHPPLHLNKANPRQAGSAGQQIGYSGCNPLMRTLFFLFPFAGRQIKGPSRCHDDAFSDNSAGHRSRQLGPLES